jgi:hypothetical protein
MSAQRAVKSPQGRVPPSNVTGPVAGAVCIPASVIQITQGIGMQPRRARKAGTGQTAFVDEIAKLFN